MSEAIRMIRRLTSPFKEFGLFAGLIYLIAQVLEWLAVGISLHLHDLMVLPVSDKKMLPPEASNGIEIREIKPGDPELDLMPVSTATVESRFMQSAVCLGAFQKGGLIGYIWLCLDEYEEDVVRCTYALNPSGKSAFDFDLYIFPQYRMGRGFARIWDGAYNFLHRRGIRYTFSRMTRFNLASRRAHAHLGCKRVGTAIYLAFGKKELMLASIAPYWHLSLQESVRARLQLNPGKLLSNE